MEAAPVANGRNEWIMQRRTITEECGGCQSSRRIELSTARVNGVQTACKQEENRNTCSSGNSTNITRGTKAYE